MPANSAKRASFAVRLRNRDFLALWLGQVISQIGDSFTYLALLITDLSIAWLEERDPSRPFCLMTHFKNCHEAWNWAERHGELFAAVELPEPASLWEDKAHRSDGSRDSELPAEHSRRQDDGQHIDGGPGIEKRDRGTEAGSARTNPREERQHGAGTHGEDASRNRSDTVRQHLVRPGAKVLRDRRLRDEAGDRAGDEEGRDQAEEHVLPRVLFRHMEGFDEGALKSGMRDGQEVRDPESRYQQDELGSLFHFGAAPVRKGPGNGRWMEKRAR